MRCNICGSTEFADMNARKGVRCKKCGSLERTRLLYMYIQKLNLTNKSRILHIAPERGLSEKLYEIAGDNYISADISREYEWCRNFRQIDLTELDDIPSNSYDLIVHSHVMEHIPCNIAYTLFHLHRILKPQGVHLCVIPFTGMYWDECFAEIGEKERKRRFGQEDHVRRFGRKDLSKSLGKIIRLPEKVDLLQDFTESELKEANIPEDYWHEFSMSTVLKLRKEDYLLTDGRGENIQGTDFSSCLADSEEIFRFAKEAQSLRECLTLKEKENRGLKQQANELKNSHAKEAQSLRERLTLKEKENQGLKQQANEFKNSHAKEAQSLRERLTLKEKENQGLKQQANELKNSARKMKKYEAEARKHKESIRYRLGTAIVEAVTSVRGFFLLPVRVTGLLFEKIQGRRT